MTSEDTEKRREEKKRKKQEKRKPKNTGLKTGHYKSIRTGGTHVKYYMIGEVETTDQSWVPGYVKNVTGMVERWGGRYLARTPNAERVEGERKPQGIVVIVEWPSKEAAAAFYESEEYRPYREKRLAGAKNEFVLVAGEDVTKTAHIAD